MASTTAAEVAWLLVEITTLSRGRPLMALPTMPSVLVGVGRVEEVDAEVERLAHQRDRLRLAEPRAQADAAVAAAAEPRDADLQARLAERGVLHRLPPLKFAAQRRSPRRLGQPRRSCSGRGMTRHNTDRACDGVGSALRSTQPAPCRFVRLRRRLCPLVRPSVERQEPTQQLHALRREPVALGAVLHEARLAQLLEAQVEHAGVGRGCLLQGAEGEVLASRSSHRMRRVMRRPNRSSRAMIGRPVDEPRTRRPGLGEVMLLFP